jgi:hypothetical protein
MNRTLNGGDFVAKFIRDIQMGDYTISLRENQEGLYETKLTSGEFGGLLELGNAGNDKLRIRELDIGSSYITVEQLAFMLVLTETDEAVVKEINRIREERNKK